MKKRFIEWDLPLVEISEQSAREKNIRHGHPCTLHTWWARRPLCSSRITNFASLIDLPENDKEKQKILNLIKNIAPWESVKNENNACIDKAIQMINNQYGGKNPLIIDPFSGGGSIPLEAARLGCDTIANDYNPVAVFIEKATIEWPQNFGKMIPHPLEKPGIDGETKKINFLSYMVNRWTKIISSRVKEEIDKFYPKNKDESYPIGYFWARTIPCQNPNCRAEIPLIRQFWLSKKKNKKIAYKPIIDHSSKKIEFEIIMGDMGSFNPSEGTIARGNAICPVCKQVTGAKKIRTLARSGEMGEKMIAIAFKHKNKSGKFYRISSEEDINIFKDSEIYLKNKINKWKWLDMPLPEEELPLMSGVFNVPLYGMDNWSKLYNSRQKLAMLTYIEKVKEAYDEIRHDVQDILKYNNDINPNEASKAIMGYFGIFIDEIARFTTNLNVWKVDAEAVVHIFGRQAIGMGWDYFENNPNGSHGGTFIKRSSDVMKVIENTKNTAGKISCVLGSATNLSFPDEYFDAVFTDPPYYNNVPYADLSDFFYVWLKRSVGDIFPDLFSTSLSPKKNEICEMSGWDSRRYKNKDKYFFEEELSNSFKEIYRILKPEGIAIIVYAHKTTAGWETVLNSLIASGLIITASWPIRTEMASRLRARSSATLASSIYMICRKGQRKKVGFYNEIKKNIKDRVIEKLQHFWNKGIAGGDFFISAIGPGMEIFSQYERVEKLSGEEVNTSELLDFIRTVSTDFIVNKLLKDSSTAKIDNESEFYLAYRWTYLDNTVQYDDARKLASASGVNLEKLWDSKGFVKKSGSKISVLGPKDRDKFEKPKSMVDVMHKTVLLWEKGEKEKLTQLLAETGYGKDPAFKQFCQAVAESLLNGNKEKQLLEGFLIGIDAYSKGKAKIGKDQTDLKQFGGN